ncbi:MAG TPA: mechanosensitive ion channel family protein [Ktedonobacteraceae bacterium]|nr:mechanosensitive ion channel family protein [Ktedonobacteraceae bacterium]
MNFSRALATLQSMVDSIIGGLPNFVLAVAIFALFYFVAKRVRLIVIKLTEKQHKAKNLGIILGKLAQSGVILMGLLVVLSILFPSFNPGDLIQLLGIGSVAIGFAFHDLFQNFLAGILLLLTAPFKIGDQIVVQQFEGTVEDIAMRATTIKTYDGRRIVIPNTDLFTNSVTVNTAFENRCQEYQLEISFEEDVQRVKTILLETFAELDGVLSQPPAEVLVIGLTHTNVTLRLSWWTRKAGHPDVLHLQDTVLTALKAQLAAHHVLFPTPSQHILLQHLPEKSQEQQADGLVSSSTSGWAENVIVKG